MSRDTLLKDDAGTVYSFDNLATQKWLEGHYSGLDGCVEWLNSKAGKLFSARDNAAAVAMQRLSDEMKDELRPRMVARAKEHEEEFPFTLKEHPNHEQD